MSPLAGQRIPPRGSNPPTLAATRTQFAGTDRATGGVEHELPWRAIRGGPPVRPRKRPESPPLPGHDLAASRCALDRRLYTPPQRSPRCGFICGSASVRATRHPKAPNHRMTAAPPSACSHLVRCWPPKISDLSRGGRASAGQVADVAGLTIGRQRRSSIAFEQAGLVRRCPDARDGRRVVVEPTPTGVRQAADALTSLRTAAGTLLDSYSAEELLRLQDFVRDAREVVASHASTVRRQRLRSATGVSDHA